MATMYVVPAEGLVIRDPVTLIPLPLEGAEVPLSQHWLRRLERGDVREVPRPPAGGIVDPEAAGRGREKGEAGR